MLNSPVYSKHLRAIILKIQQISDQSLKIQSIEAFKQILIASFSSTPITLTTDASNYATLQAIKLVEFADFVKSTINAADYESVQDLLVEKSGMFRSIEIEIGSLFDNAASAGFSHSEASMPVVPYSGAAINTLSSAAIIEEEGLSGEEQNILSSISGLDTDSNRPYFLPSQRQIVIEYVRARLAYSKAVLLSNEMRIAQNTCAELRERFTANLDGISLDSEQTPTLFTKVNEASAAVGCIVRKRFICEVIHGYPAGELDSLSPDALTRVYTAAVNINNSLQAINSMIEYFMQTEAKLNPPLPVIRVIPQFFGDLKLDNVNFTITAPDKLMGYTLHNMLLVSKQVATSTTVDTPYGGETAFSLDKGSLAQLRQYLSELKTWYADFNVILSCLFGNKVTTDQYTKTGQKALIEIIAIEKVRKRDGLTPLIKEATVREFESLSHPELRPVLLLGQVALDLTAHPDRENLKRFFESLYKIHGFKDAKGEHKTFIKTPGYQYMSLLSIPNIQGLFEDIMAQAGLTAIAREMGYTSANAEEFWSATGASSLIELYNQQLGTKLSELPIYPLKLDGRLDEAVSAKKTVRSTATGASFLQRGNQDFSILKRSFDTRVKMMLNQLCSIRLQTADDLTPELSVAERQELERLLLARRAPLPASFSRDDLLDERRRVLLSDLSKQADHASIKTVEDIEHLFAIFKACDAYAVLQAVYEERRQEILMEGGVCEELPNLLIMLEHEFKRRIQSAGSNAASSQYYGYIPLDLTNDVLLQSFAAMYHQDKTRVTPSSMVNYFLTIGELATPDTHGHRDMSHCDRGFAGRVASAAACLDVESQNPLKEIELALRKRLANEVANSVLRAGSESSMQFANLPYIMCELGLGSQPVADPRNRNQDVIDLYLRKFAKNYTPAALYTEYYQAMVNNFKAYTVDEPTEEDLTNLYKLFQMLGFTSSREGDLSHEDKAQLDLNFRVNGENPDSKWNLSKFIYHLPEKLIETLIINKLLVPNHAKRNSQELVTLEQRSFPIPTIEEPIGVVSAARADGYAGMYASMGFAATPQDRPAVAAAAGSSLGWGGFFGSTSAQQPSIPQARPVLPTDSDAVRRVADSRLTQAPTNTSSS